MIEKMLKRELLFDHVTVSSHYKKDALFRIGSLCADYIGISADEMIQALELREHLGSTSVGGGIAIPHARLDVLAEPVIAVVRFDSPIEWEAFDKEGVKTAVVLAVPEKEGYTDYLETIALISRKLMDEGFVSHLTGNQSNEELYKYLMATVRAQG